MLENIYKLLYQIIKIINKKELFLYHSPKFIKNMFCKFITRFKIKNLKWNRRNFEKYHITKHELIKAFIDFRTRI